MENLILQSQSAAKPMLQSVYVDQLDSGRTIKCKVIDVDISTVVGAKVYIIRPDNVKLNNNCRIENGSIIIPLTSTMLAKPGTVKAQIKMELSAGYLTTFMFHIIVLEDIDGV